MSAFSVFVWTTSLVIFVWKLIRSIRIVPPQKALIVEQLGKYHKTLYSGFHVVIPFLQKITYEHDLKEQAINVPPQDCFTKDNVRVEVDGVLYMQVVNPEIASYGVTNYSYAAIQLAQTTVRAVVGTLELDRTFEEREYINMKILSALSEVAEHWGIKIFRYEVKNIVPPPSVKSAMERQMTAERERRALVARSEGEKQSRINESLGIKMELINKSEGEKQKKINEAEGLAAEILTVSKATAQAISNLAQAISEPGGEEAIKLKVIEKFFGVVENLARKETVVVLPANLSNPNELFDFLGIFENDLKKKKI